MNLLKLVAFLTIITFAVPFMGTAQDHTQWSYNLSIYEVNVRQYTKEGTFAAFQTHLDRLQDLGVGIIWFMPIHPIGVKNRLGSLGSYYSVKDYYGINAEFGTIEGFKALVDSIHKKGMYVVIDWVGNHTSWDNVLTQSHPDWYEKNSTGGFISPHGTNWTDVIQLDFGNQAMRTYMIEAMKYWITEIHVDGFRCDAASFVPIDFWTQAVAALKSTKPDIIMIAEDDAAKYYSAGFNVTYAWSFYGFGGGILPGLYKATSNANTFSTYALNEALLYPGNNNRLYFTSNHDENSWYGTDTELFGTAAEQFSLLALTFRSVPLIYSGQEAGLNHRLKFFDKDEIVWKTHPMAGKYKTMLHFKKDHQALWNGAKGKEPVRIETNSDQYIFAFTRQYEKDRLCALFNLSNQQRTFSVAGSSYSGLYKDVFNDSLITLTDNFSMTLPAWGYKILEKTSITGVSVHNANAPQTYSLFQNYPNPFNPSTTIQYQLSVPGFVKLTVYDILGKEIEVLVNKKQEAGNYSVWFNASRHTSGLFFYKLQSGTFTDVKKMQLIQ
jgi:glycosidase